jgi:hypothetical protein
MDKYQQIMKLAEAAALIQEVMNVCDPEFHDALEDMPDRLADISDAIEVA